MKRIITYFILFIITVALIVVSAISQDKFDDLILATTISAFISFIVYIIKSNVYKYFLNKNEDIINIKIELGFIFDRINSHERFYEIRQRLQHKYNDEYLREIKYFFIEYSQIIEKYEDIFELLKEEDLIVDSMIKTTEKKKEKKYKNLRKNFKIIRNNLSKDDDFVEFYLIYKSNEFYKKNSDNLTSIILSCISVLGFVLTICLALFSVDIYYVLKLIVMFSIFQIMFQSIFGVLEYQGDVLSEKNRIKSVLGKIKYVIEDKNEQI